MNSYEENYQKLLNIPSAMPQVKQLQTQILHLIWQRTSGMRRTAVEFSQEELMDETDVRLLGFAALPFDSLAQAIAPKLTIVCKVCYPLRKAFLLLKGVLMKYVVTLNIPYGTREKYYEALYAIQTFTGCDGMFVAFVNNMPYGLECKVCIQTNSNIDEIKQLIAENKIETSANKGFDELFQDMVTARKYDVKAFPADLPKEDFLTALGNLFVFVSKADLEDAGYHLQQNTYKPRIFISYSHQDKDVVWPLVEALQTVGLHIWIDVQSIDVGENILAEIFDAIHNSDLSVIFLSEHYKTSNYSQFELLRMMSKFIQQPHKIFPVKVDKINPNDILDGIGDYRYHDYNETKDVGAFVEAIQKSITKIIKEQEHPQ